MGSRALLTLATIPIARRACSYTQTVLTPVGVVHTPGFLDPADAAAAKFAIVDVETTGLDPVTSRVVECAIVTCSGHAEVLAEWSSLIAVPGTDEIGASWLHGISRLTLNGAPVFADVAGEIVRRLRGTIVVGHVVAFDLAHLRGEFDRIGLSFPDLRGATACTRELARAHLPAGSRTLAAVCSRLGIARVDAHTALGDARATAAVLAALVRRGVDLGWREKMCRAKEFAWPTVRSRAKTGLPLLAPRGSP